VGDQIGISLEGNLLQIPVSTFDNLLAKEIDSSVISIFSNLCRINALYMIAKAGSGHIGSSFSSMDIMSYIFLKEIYDKEDPAIFFSSKGHDAPALYSVLIGIRRLDYSLINKLRRKDGLPGHPDIKTPNIVTNTGSLGMGISKAKGMIKANRIDNKTQNVYVLLGDGELQEGQIWESLHSAVNDSLDELIIIVDHNKLQSDTFVSQVSDLGDLELKFKSFGLNTLRCDGNDINNLDDVISRAKIYKNGPSIIIADTVKGKGAKIFEHTSMDSDVEMYEFHSGAPQSAFYQKAVDELLDKTIALANIHDIKIDHGLIKNTATISSKNSSSLIPHYSNLLNKKMHENPKIVALDADLILDTGLIPIKENFQNRFIECGIAEQDMVSQAGGLAINGYLPIVHSFSCFLSTRPNEQIYNNSTEDTKIIYIGSLAGLLPGGPGHSHQAIRDIASLRGIPNLTIVEPANYVQLEHLLDWAINKNLKSTYIRLVSIPCIEVKETNDSFQKPEGIGTVLQGGSNTAIITYGPFNCGLALEVADRISKELDINIKVINHPWLNKIDKEWIEMELAGFKNVVCIDNHYSEGGFGEFLSSRLMTYDINLNFSNFGVEEVPVSGTNEEVLNHHNLSANCIFDSLQSILADDKNR
jgi:transketolase